MTPAAPVPRRPAATGILGSMKKTLPFVVGGLMTVVGLVWTLQGLGYLSGSPMTGVTAWAILGPVLAGFGVALLIVAYQQRGRQGGRR